MRWRHLRRRWTEKAVSGETTTVEDLKKSGKLKKGSDVKKEDLSGAIATTERELESMGGRRTDAAQTRVCGEHRGCWEA